MKEKAFLAMPYRDDLKWLRNAIAAACRRLSIDLVSVDEQVPAGDVVAGIHHYIRASDLGYVVLTGLNPNVMYEMGLLHQAAKPTIVLSDAETQIPFDVRSLMRLEYDATARDESQLTDQIAALTGQLLRFFDHAERGALASGEGPSAKQISEQIGAPFRMADFDSDRNGYPIDDFADIKCKCGKDSFRFLTDEDEGVAIRRCNACGDEHMMRDGADFADDAEVGEHECVCGGNDFQITAGIHRYRNADDSMSNHVRWLYFGCR